MSNNDLDDAVESSSTANTDGTASVAVASGNDAIVIPEGDGLRLRSEPGFSGRVQANLPASSGLNVLGRTSDNKWIEVQTIGDSSGWVAGSYLRFNIDMNSVPITGETVVVEPPPEGTANRWGCFRCNQSIC